MFANDMGANAALMYDKMVKKLLSEAFSVQDELNLIGELVSVKLHIGDETTIRDDVTRYCTEVMIIAKKLDQSPTPEAQENWITQLNLSTGVEGGSLDGPVPYTDVCHHPATCVSSMNTVIETAAGDLVRHTLSPDTTLG
jgi:hypothetical protein